MKNRFTCLLLVLTLLPLLGGCNDEDDVAAIFTGKTWKLSRLTTKGSSKQFALEWESEVAKENSIKALAQEGQFVIEFEDSNANGTGGNFTACAIRARRSGTWNADGKSRTLTLNITRMEGGTETDILARKFVEGLGKVKSYEGDSNQLNIFFEENQVTWVMGFTAQ